jgi:SAM-dependent methyltransferase
MRERFMRRRAVWSETEVVDVAGSAFAARCYLEQAEVRRYLRRAAEEIELRDLADVGCGFGRLTPVLAEFGRAVGFEREPAFVAQARALWPGLAFHEVRELSRLPARGGSFDLVMTFTVLQHLIDREALRVIKELKSVVRRPGFVLLCEETDPEHQSGDATDPRARVTIGRPVECYEALLSPLRLVESSPRMIEPTYRRQDGTAPPAGVGTYMLFQA